MQEQDTARVRVRDRVRVRVWIMIRSLTASERNCICAFHEVCREGDIIRAWGLVSMGAIHGMPLYQDYRCMS